MISVKDIAWLAGILEGEGCFSFTTSIQIRLIMTDIDIIERVSKLFNSQIKLCKLYGDKKQPYSVSVHSHKAAQWMMTIYSFMGERRKAKIEEALSIWKNQKIVNKKGLGRKNPRGASERKQNEDIIARYRNQPLGCVHMVTLGPEHPPS